MKQRFIMLLVALSMTSVMAMARTITGVVLDASNDEPLIGASVIAKGTKVGVATNIDGEFTINVPDNAKTLSVSYIGMETQDVSISKIAGDRVEVRLVEGKNALDEVVVTGMGARKKITVTGAVTNVNVDDLKHFSTSNLSNALAGNVPGVIAMQTSGQPGKKKSELWIRGI